MDGVQTLAMDGWGADIGVGWMGCRHCRWMDGVQTLLMGGRGADIGVGWTGCRLDGVHGQGEDIAVGWGADIPVGCRHC